MRFWPFKRKQSNPAEPPPLPKSPPVEAAIKTAEGTVQALFASLQQCPKWRHITPQVLAAIPDSELEVAMFDIVWALPIKEVEDSLAALEQLGPGYQTIFTTLQLETEVGNGGFSQYFTNSTRHYFRYAREGYLRLGLSNLAQIADTAFERYQSETKQGPVKGLSDENTRDGFMESYEHSTVDQDTDRFYAEMKAAAAARVTYIRAHPEQFFGDFRDRYTKR